MPDVPARPRDLIERLLPARLAGWFGDGDLSPAFERFWEETIPVDVSRKDDSLAVRASLPGFEPPEIDARVHEGMLTVSGEHKEEKEERGERFFRRERRAGFVSRTLTLPAPVAEDQVTAESKNGVLTLTAPISEQARARHIEIKTA